MSLPFLMFLAFGSGVAAALAGRAELRISPRIALLTDSAGAYLMYEVLLLAPITAYFYMFHGDWFVLYLVDSTTVPSAIALMGLIVVVALGAGGFVLGTGLVRSQREGIAMGAVGASLLGCVAAVIAGWSRLGTMGSYAQFHGDFGLKPIGGPLLYGTAVMAVVLAAGLAYVLVRLYIGGRRA